MATTRRHFLGWLAAAAAGCGSWEAYAPSDPRDLVAFMEEQRILQRSGRRIDSLATIHSLTDWLTLNTFHYDTQRCGAKAASGNADDKVPVLDALTHDANAQPLRGCHGVADVYEKLLGAVGIPVETGAITWSPDEAYHAAVVFPEHGVFLNHADNVFWRRYVREDDGTVHSQVPTEALFLPLGSFHGDWRRDLAVDNALVAGLKIDYTSDSHVFEYIREAMRDGEASDCDILLCGGDRTPAPELMGAVRNALAARTSVLLAQHNQDFRRVYDHLESRIVTSSGIPGIVPADYAGPLLV